MKRSVTIDGSRFGNLMEFYDEVERTLTENLDWSIGRNLDAFNDVLRGGFGVHEYGEEIELVWLNSAKSERDLGYEETLRYVEAKLKTCHPTAIPFVQKDLDDLKAGHGNLLFQIITDIIRGNNHDLQLR